MRGENMAEEKQISDLSSGSITNDNDVFVMDTYDGVTVKIPYSVLKQAVTTGITPTIDSTTKHWFIGSTDTNVVAEGQNGVTPHIDNTNKHWIIGVTDTGIVAEGQNGAQGQQGIAGEDGTSISFSVSEITDGHSVTIYSSDESVLPATFNVMNGNDGSNGHDGDSIYVTTESITGGNRITIHHTDTTRSDQTIDVMDGTEIIQTISDNRTITLSASNWQGDTAPYTQTVSILGVTSDIVPIIAPSYSDTIGTALEQRSEWSKITKAVSDTNSITFKCYEDKPAVNLTAIVKVV